MRAHPFALFAPLALLLSLFWLAGLGCSSPQDNALFANDGLTSAASASAGGAAAAAAGTDSISGARSGTAGINAGEAGSQAGSGIGGIGGTGGTATTAGSSSAGGPAQRIESCDMLDAAVTNEQNGHCYRVNSEKLTFAAARDACQAAAGHLVTLGDEAEDGFAHELLDAAHWIGASDGRADRMQGTGPYSWVNGEPWDYSNWESGQPNAVGTNCADETSGAHCYEHCAFQTADGAWNDRACFHTIASLCEWDLTPGPGSAGGAGPGR